MRYEYFDNEDGSEKMPVYVDRRRILMIRAQQLPVFRGGYKFSLNNESNCRSSNIVVIIIITIIILIIKSHSTDKVRREFSQYWNNSHS
jgi:hypothetical protein